MQHECPVSGRGLARQLWQCPLAQAPAGSVTHFSLLDIRAVASRGGAHNAAQHERDMPPIVQLTRYDVLKLALFGRDTAQLQHGCSRCLRAEVTCSQPMNTHPGSLHGTPTASAAEVHCSHSAHLCIRAPNDSTHPLRVLQRLCSGDAIEPLSLFQLHLQHICLAGILENGVLQGRKWHESSASCSTHWQLAQVCVRGGPCKGECQRASNLVTEWADEQQQARSRSACVSQAPCVLTHSLTMVLERSEGVRSGVHVVAQMVCCSWSHRLVTLRWACLEEHGFVVKHSLTTVTNSSHWFTLENAGPPGAYSPACGRQEPMSVFASSSDKAKLWRRPLTAGPRLDNVSLTC